MRLPPSPGIGVLVVLLVAWVVPALAQEYEPHRGTVALGADFGFYVSDEVFNVGFTPDAYVEVYPTSRLSLRLLGGWARPEYVDGGRSLDHIRGTLSAVYNWEAGYWHPFVSAGIGLFSIQYVVGDGENVGARFRRSSLDAGAGVEYFWRPTIALKFEAQYHWMRALRDVQSGPAGWALTAGLKRYF